MRATRLAIGASVAVGLLVLAQVAWTAPRPNPGAGALVEAKRKAANDLFREGKIDEAVGLMLEVVKADHSNFRDYLLLARAYDKQNRGNDAAEQYRQVLDMVGNSPSGTEERAARAECDRRLRILDAQIARIRLAEEEFMKKLDLLEREAIAARDLRATERIFRLKAGVLEASGRKDGGGGEINTAEEWQEIGVSVVKGRKYRLRAVGSFMLGGKVPCTPDGSKDVPAVNGVPRGLLVARLYGKGEDLCMGSNGIFQAPADERLNFIIAAADRNERSKNQGTIFVLIEQID